ncbi:MAG: hypothetical protein ACREAB_07230 [Blastocatellia bacterium]
MNLKVTSTPAAEFDLTLDQGTEARWNFLALRELQTRTCYCGAEKREGQTFCRAEYFKLTPALRRALYNRIGQGYKEACQDAREYLYKRTKGRGEIR